MRNSSVPAALCVLLACSHGAAAHAFLVKAEPAVGSSGNAPKTLRLDFSEAVELRFSGIEVERMPGDSIAAQDFRHAANDGKALLVDLPPLSVGAYRVKWHVVSVDSHRTEGEFTFTVK